MTIKILGMGCANCQKLSENAKTAAEELGIKAKILKVDDIRDIMKYGAMNMPALVVDDNVIASGYVPGVEEIKKLIEQNK